MNTQYLVYLIGAAVVLYLVIDKIKISLRSFRQRQERDKQQAIEAASAQTTASLRLAAALETSAANSADAGKLLAGTLKACESIAQATVELKDAVASFEKLVGSPKETSYPADNISPPATDKEAEITGLSFEKILRGMPVQQAVAEAEEEIQKKTMIMATDLGMDEN